MAGPNQTRTIKIVVDTSGNREIKDLADKLGLVSKNAKGLASSVGLLKNAFVGYIGALGIGRIIEMSDQIQNLTNRLKIVTGTQEEAARTMGLLANLAKETKQSLGDTAETYTRLALSLKTAKFSTEQMVGLTKTLINSFRISGSTAQETVSTIVQLTQAFSRGTLRGQELNSVLSQNATLSDILRAKYGKNLLKDAEAGLITRTDFLKLIAENTERINEAAKQLTPTIAQTLTQAFNVLAIAVGKVNEELGVSSKFAKGMDVIIEKIGLVSVGIVLLALTQIPALLVGLSKLRLAFIAFSVENPLLLLLTAFTAATFILIKDVDELIDQLNRLMAAILEVSLIYDKFLFSFNKTVAKGLNKFNLLSDSDRVQLYKDLRAINDTESRITSLREGKKGPDLGIFPSQTIKERLTAGIDETSAGKVLKVKDALAALNKEYISGAINAEQYYNKILEFDFFKANKEFAEGKIQLGAYNEKLLQISKIKINKDFNEGTLSLRDFNAAIASNNIESLNNKLAEGVISLKEYNVELAKISDKFTPGGALQAGTQNYLESIGSTSQQVATAVQNAFGALENFLNNFIKTGKFNFQEFTQSILDDLQKIIVRATIIRPLAEGLLGAFSVGATGTGGAAQTGSGGFIQTALPNAKGNAFGYGNVIPFAKGGVVHSPTNFGYGNKMGLMGESGPEAILPLTRGSNGNLGVSASVTPVTINIMNNTPSEVTTQESTGPNGERTIEMLITSKVKAGIASGTYDKTFQQSYGLSRKGS